MKFESLAFIEAQHRDIEQLVGAFRTLLDGERDPETFDRFIHVLRETLTLHYDLEEMIFKALAEQGVNEERGPLFLMRAEHDESRAMLEEIAREKGWEARRPLAKAFSHHLWEHIDKEDSVLFPEIPARLKGSAAEEVDRAVMAVAAESETAKGLRETTRRYVERYPPAKADMLRGMGCVQCRHFYVTCDGMEHEWWSEEEWKNAFDRVERE